MCETPPPELPKVDFEGVTSNYKKVCSDLEGNIAMEEFLNEFQALYEALSGIRSSEQFHKKNGLEMQTRLQEEEATVERSLQQAKDAQNSANAMKEAMEVAFRKVDAAHAREQEAQEALVEAERQVAQLKQDIEQSTRAALESEEFSTLPRSQDEQRQDRERLTRETAELRAKLSSSAVAYDELEKKNMAAGAKMDTMAQHLEILSTELSKEIRQRESLEGDQHAHAQALAAKDTQVAALEEQLRAVNRTVVRLEHLDRDNKAALERMSRDLETAGLRALRAQQDYESELVRVERLTREAGQKSAALKVREEDIGRVKQEAARSIKVQELHVKRLGTAEVARADMERERDALKAVLAESEREADRLRKQVDVFKKRLDELSRERDLLSKNLSKASALSEHQVERTKQQEQTERALRTQVEQRDEEVAQHKVLAKTLERECERLRAENARRACHSEELCDQLRSKHEEAVRARREALEVNFKQHHELALFESVRTDKEVAERHLVAVKGQAERLQEKLRNVEHKSGQLKESLTAHEALSMKDELALQRAERERESARHELRQAREQLSAFRQRVLTAEMHRKRLQEALVDASKAQEAHVISTEQWRVERETLEKELQQRADEITNHKKQIKELESIASRAQMHYDQRVEDIRLLKLEIKNLRQEKSTLTMNLKNMADARQQLFRLQRDITTEQLKCKALEEEMSRPRNVHRWRYLQGEDPGRFELLQRLTFLQRRLVSQSAGVTAGNGGVGVQAVLPSGEGEERTTRTDLPTPETLHQLRQKDKQIKALLAERGMHQSQLSSLRNDIHNMGLELQDVKRKFFTLKQNEERSRRRKLAEQSSAAAAADITIPLLTTGGSNKPRFTGGGFNLNVSPEDSRLLNTP